MTYHLTLVRWQKLTRQETTNVGEDVEKGEPSYTVGRIGFLEETSFPHYTIALYDPAIALLGI